MTIIPPLVGGRQPQSSADRAREHLYPFALELLFADDTFTLGPLYFVGDNSFQLRLGASGLGATVCELFLIQVDPFTLQPILDPFTAQFYNNVLSFNQNATTFRIGANVQPPSAALDGGVQVGPFILFFYTGLGNYSSQCWLEGYHTQGRIT